MAGIIVRAGVAIPFILPGVVSAIASAYSLLAIGGL